MIVGTEERRAKIILVRFILFLLSMSEDDDDYVKITVLQRESG